MYGFFSPKMYEFVDSDDKYQCSCGCKVEFASPRNLRSLESQAQAKTRLCSSCINARKAPEFQ